MACNTMVRLRSGCAAPTALGSCTHAFPRRCRGLPCGRASGACCCSTLRLFGLALVHHDPSGLEVECRANTCSLPGGIRHLVAINFATTLVEGQGQFEGLVKTQFNVHYRCLRRQLLSRRRLAIELPSAERAWRTAVSWLILSWPNWWRALKYSRTLACEGLRLSCMLRISWSLAQPSTLHSLPLDAPGADYDNPFWLSLAKPKNLLHRGVLEHDKFSAHA
jgi:hypothetical protein